ncbi:MAG: permease, partial [Clostridia bacterium]|nr:permease [Clostridia bacterium]
MTFFNGIISISNIYTLLFVIFTVLLFGYLLGRITIKGISLGDAGVFIIALIFDALFFGVNESGELLFAASSKPYDFSSGLTIVESLG